MKWEYKEVKYTLFPSVKELNNEGKSGWELVFLRKLVDFSWSALFKRSIIKRSNTGSK